MLRDGDGLVLDDGSVVVVAGQAEPLIEISAKAPLDLVRLAWHIGNRHTDTQFIGESLSHPARSRAGGDGEGAWRADDGGRGAVRSGARRAAWAAAIITIMTDGSASAALSPDGVAVAGVSGRRVLVFERHRVGGRERRYQGRRDAQALARCRSSEQGGGFCDAVFFVHAHRAVEGRRRQSLRAVAELAAAFAPSKERHLETTAQGRAFIEATRAAWPCAALDRLARPGTGRSPIRSRSASRLPATAIALEPALSAYLHAVAANLISAGVRLIPLGQTDGQRLLAALRAGRRRNRRARARDAARSGRRRGVSRRHRQHAPRDPVHAAVPVVI